MRTRAAWLPVFLIDGPFAERDARIRFAEIRAYIDGDRSRTENRHAPEWVAVRLVRDALVVVDEYESLELLRARERPTARERIQRKT